ncbi:MAG TPA: MFS transporter, partial [Candidatus Limnocylindrales bacterium]
MNAPSRRLPPAAVLGCLTLLAIGWTGLLIPSLIRSIEATFGQDDAGIGLVYLLYSSAYAIGSFGGGPITERLGRRRVLALAGLLHGAGIAGFGLAPTWMAFVLIALPAGLGAGVLDGGSNGLFLDLFRSGRGRAMNLLHLFFSIGALTAPLVAGALVDGGVAWQAVMVGTGIALVPLAAGYLLVAVPSGRHDRPIAPSVDLPTSSSPAV